MHYKFTYQVKSGFGCISSFCCSFQIGWQTRLCCTILFQGWKVSNQSVFWLILAVFTFLLSNRVFEMDLLNPLKCLQYFVLVCVCALSWFLTFMYSHSSLCVSPGLVRGVEPLGEYLPSSHNCINQSLSRAVIFVSDAGV